ncbi:DUF5786 family protein (plasmid) [Natrinema zhouii]|uniref:DUF5786 family protein n=1 Tax=Natrinema zhouii TaxID=1710539 RepID=UPI001CFF95FA|nr:DUF5786 family protein [Natrinema zhouii]UHQ98092.1 DUF5786 family protein [Natrinema zhouii]
MGMGNFDEQEHERREKKLSEIESDSEEQPREYRGQMTFETEDSMEVLLDRLKEMKSRDK